MAEQQTLGIVAKSGDPIYTVGKELKTVPAEFSVATGDATDGDVYVLAGGLGYDSRIHRVMLPGGYPGAALAVDNDLGFYKKDRDGTLVAIDADILVDGVDLSSASAVAQDLLNKNGSLDRTKSIGELVGKNVQDLPNSGIFLCLTVNTKSSGTFYLDADVVIEQANTK